MAIPLLDERKTWGKIGAGFKGGKAYKSLPARPSHPFTDGPMSETRSFQQTDMKVSGSVFGGKTFSQRKG
jgi:hypothetical protein